jgi:hypothetical protein
MKATAATERFVRLAVLALLGPKVDPRIRFDQPRATATLHVDIDTGPVAPWPMVGRKGLIKLALQTVLAGTENPDIVQIHLTGGEEPCSDGAATRPAVEPLQSLLRAAIEHWGVEGSADVELAATTAVAILTVPEPYQRLQAPALSRLVRAIGKAQGHAAVCRIEAPTHA